MTGKDIAVEGEAQALAALQVQIFRLEQKIMEGKTFSLQRELIVELEGLYIDRNILTKKLYDL